MIGEASHGTHEFYLERAELSRQLIQKKGFTFIAVEGDWPDAYRVNRYVQHGKKSDTTAKESLGDFRRFPLWMWRNSVILDFISWMRSYNDSQTDLLKKVAFYGMDLYSFYSSMDAVIEYLMKVSPEDARVAKKRYSNFDRFQGEPSYYGFATGLGISSSLEKEVISTLVDLQKKEETYLRGIGGLIDGDELFYTKQNALLVAHAEEYYRKMYQANEVTWNIRDGHMVDSVSSLINYHKKKFSGQRIEKVIVWAHNSHIGDARYTEAGGKRREINVGQLMREKFGLKNTFNIGFSTYRGSVTASKNWDEPAQCDRVRNGIYGSFEHIFHQATENSDNKNYYLIFRTNNPNIEVNPELINSLNGSRYERYIGVIYRPDTEKASHYSKTNICKEYDSIIFMDETHAIEPIDKTIPWEKQLDQIKKVDDNDIYPELESGAEIENDSLEWRLQAASEINEVGIEMMKKNDYLYAFQKFDKALKYAEYNLKLFQNKRNLQEIRMKILINRAEASSCTKNWSSVINDCNAVLSLYPSSIEAHLLIAKALEAKGNIQESRFHFEIAAKKTSEHPVHLPIQRR